MNLQRIFKNQIEQGLTDQFFYGLETSEYAKAVLSIDIKSHKGTLDTFPKLTYIRHLSDGIPLFKE